MNLICMFYNNRQMPITYEISNDSSRTDILKYIFKNRANITNDKNVKYKVQKFRDKFSIMIGLGNYTFLYNENQMTISCHEEGTPISDMFTHISYFIRLLITVDTEEIFLKFLEDVKKSEDDPNEAELNIFISDKHGDWSLYNTIMSRKLKNVYIDESIKSKVIDDLTNFLASEEDYNIFGIPYKKTYLLTGIPGSGKTSLIKGICNKFKYNLSILSVSKKFDNESLLNCLINIKPKSILLIEDIDSLFEKRESTSDNPGLTFSNLINILDGVLYKHSAIIFLTTNHPERLDHALLRIGRIDMIIELNYPSKYEIERLFLDLIKDSTKIEFNKFYGHIKFSKMPMASIVNFLFRYRLDWETNIDELLNTNNFIRKTLKQDSSQNLYV